MLSLNQILLVNAVVNGAFAMVAIMFPRAPIYLTHDSSDSLDKEVFAVMRGWGACALCVAYITYAMRGMNHRPSKKIAVQGCLFYTAAVFSGQLFTLRFIEVLQWNQVTGYLLAIFWGVMSSINVYGAFVL
mmetsp:Transcript_13959/g.39686  ORF Transcript_13959/g.39686 Transcript_13959/m.39686 type:complete len:131 (+) Transcript_13959:109-501(+)